MVLRNRNKWQMCYLHIHVLLQPRPYRRSRAGVKLLQWIRKIASIVNNVPIISESRRSRTKLKKRCLVPLVPPLIKEKKYKGQNLSGSGKCKINLWKN